MSGRVDRAVESASRAVEGLLHRRFYPMLDTRTFDWPGSQYARSWRLWLDQNELLSVTTFTSGGVALAPGDYFLRPDDGPPFTFVEINLDSSGAFSSAGTHQRAISITGLYGAVADEAPAGELTSPMSDVSTTAAVSDASIGVGTILRAGSERMLVTGKSWADTGQNIGANLAASAAGVAVTVTDGSEYAAGETILVDAERMLIVDVAGNTLVVRRAVEGSVLAAHSTGADVYAPRTLTVTRAALGTTASSHSSGAALVRHVVPGLVRDLAIAEAIVQLQSEAGGYNRTSGSGESVTDISGRGIADIRDRARTAYGRKARIRGV